jgi:hypothetical protein
MQTDSRWLRLGVASATVLAIASALTGVAGRAGASSLGGANLGARPRPTLAGPLTAGKAAATLSIDQAAYTAEPSAGVASASVSFTIPTVTCPANGDQGFMYPGVRTNSSIAVMDIYCPGSGAAAVYDYDLVTPSGQDLQPASAGDTVIATIFETTTITQAEIHDLTNGQFWLDSYTGDAGDSIVGIGDFTDTSEGVEVPTFAPVTMSNVQVNGDYLGFESPTQYNDYNPNNGHVVITTGAVKTASSGSSFKLTFKKAY